MRVIRGGMSVAVRVPSQGSAILVVDNLDGKSLRL